MDRTEKPSARSGADFFVGDCLVKREQREIVVAGRVHKVHEKTAAVLAALASRPGAVVPRDQLLKEVWDADSARNAALTKAVSDIRKLFRDIMPEEPLVVTVPKVGYQLVAPVKQLPSAAFEDTPDITTSPRTVSDTPAMVPPDHHHHSTRIRWDLAVAALLAAAALLSVVLPTEA